MPYKRKVEVSDTTGDAQRAKACYIKIIPLITEDEPFK